MTKGILQPSFVKGFTQYELDEFKKAWISHKIVDKAVFKLVNEENPEQRKKRIWDMLEEVIKRVRSRTPIKADGGGVYSPESDQAIISYIFQVFTQENHVVVGRYKIRDYVDHVKAMTRHHEWLNDMTRYCKFNFPTE
jgi:hypothetical protein